MHKKTATAAPIRKKTLGTELIGSSMIVKTVIINPISDDVIVVNQLRVSVVLLLDMSLK
jgi:hypothetical protein